jgi:hypothetical protein
MNKHKYLTIDQRRHKAKKQMDRDAARKRKWKAAQPPPPPPGREERLSERAEEKELRRQLREQKRQKDWGIDHPNGKIFKTPDDE